VLGMLALYGIAAKLQPPDGAPLHSESR
jgi:hypothetical protein